VLTIVIGGNHEASNYMSELYAPTPRAVCILQVISSRRYHGGWLAPNIYFLGHAGCIQVNGIRIAGASGIFKSSDFNLGDSPITFLDTPASNTCRSLRKIAL
jgi:lariat debranching enzyme